MGYFKKNIDNQRKAKAAEWAASLPHDGRLHVALWHVFSKTGTSASSGFDEKATPQVNDILDVMTDFGLEIVDVRCTVSDAQGYAGADRWDVVVTYR